ncbi:ribosylnicotinamide kinase [Onygenales sp. PD_40]|nr:ribosylnicotinamide kinase [Onygenales sp. PD_40]KAK2789798.1 ribosylnicotinamide kinase [Onygenales sp. PD_12]
MSAPPPAEHNASPSQSQPQPQRRKTIVIGISGPSSSGKTTLARLLRTVFTPAPEQDRHEAGDGKKDTGEAEEGAVRAFIIHEDDFYKPDDQIPITTTSSGHLVQDWDTISALDIRALSSALTHVRAHGALPPRLRSKEDRNDAGESGVDTDTIARLRAGVTRRVDAVLREGLKEGDGDGGKCTISLAFIDGFLLYAPPGEEKHPLRSVRDCIDVPLFLPATYSLLKERREGRSGYVTIGPAPTPALKEEGVGEGGVTADDDDGASGGGIGSLEDEGDPFPEQNFWTDPPGYVDDIVWPRYVIDHFWLLVGDSGVGMGEEELKRVVGEGEMVRGDMGVLVAPGLGRAGMRELLEWAVDEVVGEVERVFRG